MAVYILMKKEMENKELVVYEFGPSEEKMGKLEYNKCTKKVTVLEQVNDGLISNESYEHWVVQKIVRIVMAGGAFPDKTAVEH